MAFRENEAHGSDLVEYNISHRVELAMGRNDMNKTLFILVISAFLLFSCGLGQTPIPAVTDEVDPVFRELYGQLGGMIS